MLAEVNVIEKLFSDRQVLAVFMALLIPIVVMIGYYWHEIVKTRSAHELKQSMLERGMSAPQKPPRKPYLVQ